MKIRLIPRAVFILILFLIGTIGGARGQIFEEAYPLHAAAVKGDIERVEELIAQGADLEKRTPMSLTPLIAALNRRQGKTALALIEAGAKLKPPVKYFENKEGILFQAASTGSLPLVQTFIDSGIDVENHPTAIIGATRGKNPEVVQLLLNKGADVNARWHHGDSRTSTLPACILAGAPQSILQMLIDAGADLDAQFVEDGQYARALHLAIIKGESRQTVSRLLIAGADVNAKAKHKDALVRPLHLAVRYNRSVELIQTLLDAGAAVNQLMIDPNGRELPAIYWAARRGSTDHVKALLHAGASVDTQILPTRRATDNPDRKRLPDQTLLDIAIRWEHFKTAQILQEAGGTITLPFPRLNEALEVAVEKGNEIWARTLVRAGADPYSSDGVNTPAIRSAIDLDRKVIVRSFIEEGVEIHPELPSVMIREGWTSELPFIINQLKTQHPNEEFLSDFLLEAIKHGSDETIRLLLELGADLTTTTDQGDTPLHLAADYERTAMVELLLQKGATVDPHNFHNETPLMVAISNSSLPIINLLLDAGAQLTAEDKFGRTPMHVAATRKSIPILKRLLQADTPIDIHSDNGDLPIHKAVRNAENVRLLLEAGSPVDPVNDHGNTPLRRAVNLDNVESVRYLLEAGANVETRGEDSRTPLFIAIGDKYHEEPNHQIVRLLLEAGANPNATDQKGRTPLNICIDDEKTELIDLLKTAVPASK